MGINIGKLRMKIIELEAEELVRYQQVVENFLSRKKDVISSHFDKLSDSKNEDYEEDYLSVLEDTLSEEYHRFDTNFSSSFRTSVLVLTYSFLESKLNELCDDVCETQDSSDLKSSSNIDKSKIYLKKTCNIDFGILSPEWEFVNKVKLLRNSIVHSSGEFKLVDESAIEQMNAAIKNDKILAAFVKNNSSLSVVKNVDSFIKNVPRTYKVLIIDGKLSLDFMENVSRLFQKLTREIFKE
jgi:hypothetical protein